MLLNADGTPKVFYHGTSANFAAFDTGEIAARENSFFFAENREDAEGYGKNVFEVYLSANNLADYDNQPREFYHLENKRAQVEYLKKRGYDGWYADMDSGGWGEVSVFSPTQIKSATDNIGTFDSGNPDIRYSLSGYGSMEKLAEAFAEIAESSDATYYETKMAEIEAAAKEAGFDELLDEYIAADAEYEVAKGSAKKIPPHELYQRTAGEVEARDVANRVELTAEQRKNIRPDIDRLDVVVAKSSKDTREVYLFDGRQAYRLELCIANLSDGTKIAYVKRYIEKANQAIEQKIKKAETSVQNQLNQPSISIISQKSDLSTDSAEKSSEKFSKEQIQSLSGYGSMEKLAEAFAEIAESEEERLCVKRYKDFQLSFNDKKKTVNRHFCINLLFLIWLRRCFFEVALIKFASGYLLFVGRTRRITQCLTPTFVAFYFKGKFSGYL